MNIAFYAPLKPPDHPVASGDRAMARLLMAAWRLPGHEVRLASRLRSYDAGNSERQQRIQLLGQKTAERLLTRWGKAGYRPDLWFTYHLYHKAPDWLGPPISTRLQIPYFVAEASYAPKQERGPWALGHRATADAIRRADRIFQPNPADTEWVLPLLHSPDRIVLLPPFLDTAPLRSLDRAHSRTASAERFGLDPRTPWLLTVAMMRADQKLASYRLLASSLLRISSTAWSLVIAGAGPAERQVREAFAPFGDRIRWVGMLDRDILGQLYRGSDVYVWPAVKEAWGMAFLEAQSAGLPVVAGRSGGVSSIVADGETGLLVPEGDVSAFAKGLGELLKSPDLRTRMSEAAMSRTARIHDIAQAAEFLDRHLRASVATCR